MLRSVATTCRLLAKLLRGVLLITKFTMNYLTYVTLPALGIAQASLALHSLLQSWKH